MEAAFWLRLGTPRSDASGTKFGYQADRTGRRPESYERPTADEVPHGRIGVEVIPAQDPCEEAQPPRVSASELDCHGEALVVREETLLRCERLPPDLDLNCRMGSNVPNPVGVLTPDRADDCLVGLRVVGQGHRDGGVELAGPPSRVDDQQERMAEEPAPSPAIYRQRQSEDRESRRPGWRRTPRSGLACRPIASDVRHLMTAITSGSSRRPRGISVAAGTCPFGSRGSPLRRASRYGRWAPRAG